MKTIPLPAVGERLMVTGKWSSHQSYGKQFEAEFLERVLPQNTADIIRYLSGRIIKGIGPRTKESLLAHFKSVKRIKEAPMEEVAAVIGKSKAEKLAEVLKKE